MEALARRRTEIVKAIAGLALPLVLPVTLIKTRYLETLQVVWDGIDMLLGQQAHPRSVLLRNYQMEGAMVCGKLN
jgi:hypothetical protein